jgi:hypothetical protein
MQSTETLVTGKYEKQFHAKVRFFVVVREGHDCCTCLPIQTFQNRGVAKTGLKKHEHAIIYTGDSPPSPTEREQPGPSEMGMQQSIRVEPTNPKRDYLTSMSRICFAKVYTVEHNAAVYDFGNVDQNFHARLYAQWWSTMASTQNRQALSYQPVTIAPTYASVNVTAQTAAPSQSFSGHSADNQNIAGNVDYNNWLGNPHSYGTNLHPSSSFQKPYYGSIRSQTIPEEGNNQSNVQYPSYNQSTQPTDTRLYRPSNAQSYPVATTHQQQYQIQAQYPNTTYSSNYRRYDNPNYTTTSTPPQPGYSDLQKGSNTAERTQGGYDLEHDLTAASPISEGSRDQPRERRGSSSRHEARKEKRKQ